MTCLELCIIVHVATEANSLSHTLTPPSLSSHTPPSLSSHTPPSLSISPTHIPPPSLSLSHTHTHTPSLSSPLSHTHPCSPLSHTHTLHSCWLVDHESALLRAHRHLGVAAPTPGVLRGTIAEPTSGVVPPTLQAGDSDFTVQENQVHRGAAGEGREGRGGKG